MAARKKDSQINLIPEKGFETSTLGRVLAWILSTFRIIVIITEIIVMIAFLSRFWLDAQNTDLNEKLDEKKAILTASQSFEKEFRIIQKKLDIYSTISSQEGYVTSSFATITSYLPTDLFLTSVNVDGKQIEISGASPNERSIQQFMVNLQSTGKFSDISLIEVGTDLRIPNLLTFKIATTIPGKENNKK